jgi:hypothetical protein
MTKEIEIANYQTRVLNPVNENTKVIERNIKKPGMSNGKKAAIAGGGVGGTAAIVTGIILL